MIRNPQAAAFSYGGKAFHLVSAARRVSAFLLGGMAVAMVAGFSIFGGLAFPRLLHLSITAEAFGDGKLVVTRVVTGGLGYDAGIRPGDIVMGFTGGRLEQVPGKTTLRDPVSVEVTGNQGISRRVDANDLYWVGRSGPPVLAVVALMYVLIGAGVFYLRPWDPVARWTFLFFFSMGLALSVGIFSGIWGGVATLFLEALGLFAAGATLVALMQTFPRRTGPLHRVHLAIRNTAIGLACVVLLLYAAMLLGLWDWLAPVLRPVVGLYLPVCLGIGVGEAVWSYRHTRSARQRLQIRVAGLAVVIGLAPTFFLLIPSLVVFNKVAFVPFLIVSVSLAIIPAGWAYALLQPALRAFHERVQQALAVAAVLMAGFVIAFGITSLAVKSFNVQPQTLAEPLSLLMGLLVAALIAIALGAVGMVRRSLEIGQALPLSAEEKQATGWLPEVKRLAARAEAMSGVAVSVLVDGNQGIRVGEQAEEALVYGMREALENVVLHSGAAECVIRINLASQTVRLLVIDDGRGFEPWGPGGEPLGWGSGLATIRAKVDALGGSFGIISGQRRGTMLHLSIPVGR